MAASYPVSYLGKLAFFFTAYLGQHTPVGFIWLALPVIFRKSGFPLSQIGLLGILYTPWALKFLYAPVVDRFSLPSLLFGGRKKAWILFGRIIALVFLYILSFCPPETGVLQSCVLIFIINTAFALGDIALDGVSTNSFTPSQRSWGAGIQITGNFTGFMVGGGVFLIVFQHLGWSVSLKLLTLFLFLLSLPLLFIRENGGGVADGTKETVRLNVAGFVRQRQTIGFFFFLLLMALVLKTGYQLRMTMLFDLGISPVKIGTWMLWAGSPVAIIGTFLGSSLSRNIPSGRLFTAGCLWAAAVAVMSWLLAEGICRGTAFIALTMGMEQILMGTMMASIYGLILGISAGPQSATNFGILCGTQHLTTFLAVYLGGWAGQYLGYATVFAMMTPLCLVVIFLLRLLFAGSLRSLDTMLVFSSSPKK